MSKRFYSAFACLFAASCMAFTTACVSGGDVDKGAGTGGTGGGGAGGSAGSARACAKPPLGGLITDFSGACSGDAGTCEAEFGMWGGFFGGTWPATQGGTFTTSVATGAWVFSGTVSTNSGTGVWLDKCVDASAYSGVQFTVQGNAGPTGQMLMDISQLSNWAISSGGSCDDVGGVCAPAQTYFPVTATVQTIKLPWTSFTNGVPNDTIDKPGELKQLDFWMDQNAPLPFTVNVTIDDLMFYK
jgi:hypothetical protein